MGWFSKEPDKAALTGRAPVKVNGARYVIRKLNPLMDFTAGSMPQVFATFQSRRKAPEPDGTESAKALKDMMAVVEAGVVEPELVPVGKGELRGKEDGITVEDLFRDGETGPLLYVEILAHSLNRYKGVRGSVFLAVTRQRLSTAWRSATDAARAQSPSETVSSV